NASSKWSGTGKFRRARPDRGRRGGSAGRQMTGGQWQQPTTARGIGHRRGANAKTRPGGVEGAFGEELTGIQNVAPERFPFEPPPEGFEHVPDVFGVNQRSSEETVSMLPEGQSPDGKLKASRLELERKE